MAETTFKTEMLFGGKLEACVKKSTEKLREKLEGIKEQAKEGGEQLSAMGMHGLELGMVEAGKEAIETQSQLQVALTGVSVVVVAVKGIS